MRNEGKEEKGQKRPALSVIVPVYNGAAVLEACLKAIRASSFKDYELIVIDDGSTDASATIAAAFADKVVGHGMNLGLPSARKTSEESARGEILVCIDADVVVRVDTLARIDGHFRDHPDADAVVGLLAKDCPLKGFFTQYKNLYMHYIFRRLPREITFLYGSIHAYRRGLRSDFRDSGYLLWRGYAAEDTDFGQYLASHGKRIHFMPELEVTHLKQYTFASFVKNDFRIPFQWADIFLRYKGWRQLGKKSTGFAHSPGWQIASVLLAPFLAVLAFTAIFRDSFINFLPPLIFAWLLFNSRFLLFMAKAGGIAFGVLSIPVTFMDHIVMACGIFFGSLASVHNRIFAGHLAFKNVDAMTPTEYSRYLYIDKMVASLGEEKLCACDVGCGRGNLLSVLEGRLSGAKGIDSSVECVEAARARARSPRISFEKKDLFELREKFELVFLTEVLEHLEDDAKALRYLHDNIIRKDKWLIMTVPAHGWLYSRDDRQAGHFRRYDKKALDSLLRSSGFELVSLWSYGVIFFNFAVNIFPRYRTVDEKEFHGNKKAFLENRTRARAVEIREYRMPYRFFVSRPGLFHKMCFIWDYLLKDLDMGMEYCVLCKAL
jgi:glycosyltransferase involved in cell wall biosynthesis